MMMVEQTVRGCYAGMMMMIGVDLTHVGGGDSGEKKHKPHRLGGNHRHHHRELV